MEHPPLMIEDNAEKDPLNYLRDLGIKVVIEKSEYDPEAFQEKREISIKKIETFFGEKGFEVEDPIPLVIKDGTTLFATAGIQKIDSCMHDEREFPRTPFFVSQPVLRSQFIGSRAVESHTAFHNLATIDINCTFEKHLEYTTLWIDFLVQNGFSRELFEVDIISSSPKWGKRKFNNLVIGINYAGLDIGDAVYIPSMPQDSRESFSISDIGFGLERINHTSKDSVNADSAIALDCLKTLSLIAISGVEPSNTSHGYRFRLFSKKLISQTSLDFTKLKEFLKETDGFLLKWTESTGKSDIDLSELREKIIIECERNFNRELMTYLNDECGLGAEIEINQRTTEFIRQLEILGVKDDEFWAEIKKKINI